MIFCEALKEIRKCVDMITFCLIFLLHHQFSASGIEEDCDTGVKLQTQYCVFFMALVERRLNEQQPNSHLQFRSAVNVNTN